mmetsp:Transcript_11561/g.20906  ORF Transcript_11561/g.20906 Transcript_11561/m.20906 type:complete len:168 (-) Transcript_11561:268-771(-)|eukprot:CAMPEP_0177759670 /NCGR_PEP_ID=MMETSP0491_2-20121128/4854_1 /TAXON_ID=63592 /ORGANISM="Tetraselmis chuii, Strain PLY429" /LENGTH=167 /DNA_ID=CAMNT_0019275511 /DNA_START=245 /DNA_END=748 /DNA_ORIENTATION=-
MALREATRAVAYPQCRHATLWRAVMGTEHTRHPSSRRSLSSGVQAGSGNKAKAGGSAAPIEEVPEPPSTGVAMVSMGFGALGAVAIAAVGVVGAFKMALWAASESGRSMSPEDKASAVAVPNVAAQPTKAELEVELAALRRMERSAEIDAEKAAIKKELKLMKTASS